MRNILFIATILFLCSLKNGTPLCEAKVRVEYFENGKRVAKDYFTEWQYLSKMDNTTKFKDGSRVHFDSIRYTILK